MVFEKGTVFFRKNSLRYIIEVNLKQIYFTHHMFSLTRQFLNLKGIIYNCSCKSSVTDTVRFAV